MTKIDVEDFGASLADDIHAIKKTIRNTKLNEDGLVILIAEVSKVRRDDVRAVLRAMDKMPDKYLKPGA